MTPSPPTMSDAEIIRGCLAHRGQLTNGFEALYQRHSDGLFRFLVALLRDESQAEDLLQESFFRAYKALDRYDPARPFEPWLFRIARNAALDYLRSRKAKGAVAISILPNEAEAPENTVASAEESERRVLVQEALDALPSEPRSVLIMKHFHDLTAKQIAEVLSVSLRTAKYRLKDAAQLLGLELKRRAITVEAL